MVKSGDTCTKCSQNYILKNGICIFKISYIDDNCNMNNLDTSYNQIDQVKCLQCKENSHPMTFLNKFQCIKNEWTSVLFQNIDYCVKYTVSNYNTSTTTFQNVVCKKCLSGYYITATNTCVQTCPSGTIPYNYDIVLSNSKYTFDRNFVCVANTTNCAQGSILINAASGGTLRKGCISCLPGYQQQILLVISTSNVFNSPINSVGITSFSFD